MRSQDLEQPTINDTSADLAEEFLKQNEAISQEIMNHNNLLKTCPMLLYRIWIIFYASFAFFTAITLFMIFGFSLIKGVSLIYSLIINVALWNFIFSNIILACGCIFMWISVFSKNLSRVEKSLLLFKIYALTLTISYISLLIYYTSTPKEFDWKINLAYLLLIALAFNNIFTGIYVRNVLVKREIFCNVSSFSNNPT